jgi:hypothetical protein
MMEFPHPEVVRFYIETLASEIGGDEMPEETREYESSYAHWDARSPSILYIEGREGEAIAFPLSPGETNLLLSLEREGEYEDLFAEMDAIAERAYKGR